MRSSSPWVPRPPVGSEPKHNVPRIRSSAWTAGNLECDSVIRLNNIINNKMTSRRCVTCRLEIKSLITHHLIGYLLNIKLECLGPRARETSIQCLSRLYTSQQKEIFQNISRIFTARKRSLGQGNVFTPVCHSVHGGRGVVCLIACWHTPPSRQNPPWADTPPRQTSPYGQQAGGTHPIGMHTYLLWNISPFLSLFGRLPPSCGQKNW